MGSLLRFLFNLKYLLTLLFNVFIIKISKVSMLMVQLNLYMTKCIMEGNDNRLWQTLFTAPSARKRLSTSFITQKTQAKGFVTNVCLRRRICHHTIQENLRKRRNNRMFKLLNLKLNNEDLKEAGTAALFLFLFYMEV